MADTTGPTTVDAPPNPQRAQLTPPPSQSTITPIDAAFPSTSITDSGLSKRPRDARLIHLILANFGLTAYQERVPLQLMDFAYRYTSSILQDAIHLTSETYPNAPTGGGRGGGGAAGDASQVTMMGLRLAIASRTHYQYNPNLPKEFYQDIAMERNRIALPVVGREYGVRLPPERYCLTGVGWGLKDEWDSDGEGEGEGGGDGEGERGIGAGDGGGDLEMGMGEAEAEGEDGDAKMEDFFGEDWDVGKEGGDAEGS